MTSGGLSVRNTCEVSRPIAQQRPIEFRG